MARPTSMTLIGLTLGAAAGLLACTGEVGSTKGAAMTQGHVEEPTGPFANSDDVGEPCLTEEVCGNAIDDDCDGTVDEECGACLWENIVCGEEIEACNGDAACTKKWVTQRCSGEVTTDNAGGQITYRCSDKPACATYVCTVQPAPCVWQQERCDGQVDHCGEDLSCYRKWVTDRCNGTVATASAGQPVVTTFSCADNDTCRTYTCEHQATTAPPPPPQQPPTCSWSESVCGLGHCNTHLGDNYDACIAAGNAGCSQDELHAWCMRRVDGSVWFNFLKSWVTARCNGPVELVNIDGTDTWTCSDDAACIVYQCQTPLVLSFDPQGSVAVRSSDGGALFDLSPAQDGSATRTDWPEATTPWLVLDRDGDGAITSGRELFGSATLLPHGPADNGFAALAALDDNSDGRIDAGDAAFARLQLWRDADGDRRSTTEELTGLAEAGVRSLDLSYRLVRQCDARGNCARQRAAFTWTDAQGNERGGALIDLHLGVRPEAPAMGASKARCADDARMLQQSLSEGSLFPF